MIQREHKVLRAFGNGNIPAHDANYEGHLPKQLTLYGDPTMCELLYLTEI